MVCYCLLVIHACSSRARALVCSLVLRHVLSAHAIWLLVVYIEVMVVFPRHSSVVRSNKTPLPLYIYATLKTFTRSYAVHARAHRTQPAMRTRHMSYYCSLMSVWLPLICLSYAMPMPTVVWLSMPPVFVQRHYILICCCRLSVQRASIVYYAIRLLSRHYEDQTKRHAWRKRITLFY